MNTFPFSGEGVLLPQGHRNPYPPEFRELLVALLRACDLGPQRASAASPRKPAAQDGARDSEKGHGLGRSGDRLGAPEVFEFIKGNQAHYPVRTLCRLLGVSPSGSYAYLRRMPSVRSARDLQLLHRIARFHRPCRGTYGRRASTKTSCMEMASGAAQSAGRD